MLNKARPTDLEVIEADLEADLEAELTDAELTLAASAACFGACFEAAARRDELVERLRIMRRRSNPAAYKIRIKRKQPKDCGGLLELIEGTAIDASWLHDRYGGGEYELYYCKRSPDGGWLFDGTVTVMIAGEPTR